MATRTEELQTLAKLVHNIRPDWHTNGILRVLENDNRPVDVLTRLAIDAAHDITARGPGVISTRNEMPAPPPVPLPPSVMDVLARAPSQPDDVAIAGAKRVREAVAAHHAECADNRAAVLAYPDLAAELTRPPLSYPRPEHWNGYVPPRFDPEDHNDVRDLASGRRINTSRRRIALAALVAEAQHRKESDAW